MLHRTARTYTHLGLEILEPILWIPVSWIGSHLRPQPHPQLSGTASQGPRPNVSRMVDR